MTTATTTATREQNIQQIRRMFDDVKPQHLTDDELAAMVEVIKPAWDRMQEPMPGVVYLDSVRCGRGSGVRHRSPRPATAHLVAGRLRCGN